MLYIPKFYFSFFGMLAYSVSALLFAIHTAVEMLNTLQTQRIQIILILTHLNARIQSKTKDNQ